MKDKCGPQGKGVIQTSLSAFVPDKPFGVNLISACKKHDKAWKEEANKKADLQFKDDILDSFYFHAIKKDWNKVEVGLFMSLGYITAYIYYIGVRLGGVFYKLGA